jgi:hypothetical protein
MDSIPDKVEFSFYAKALAVDASDDDVSVTVTMWRHAAELLAVYLAGMVDKNLEHVTAQREELIATQRDVYKLALPPMAMDVDVFALLGEAANALEAGLYADQKATLIRKIRWTIETYGPKPAP